ncbi:asparagine synthase-related protein [Plantactinospora veratri]|uniref:Asparagine synthase-related protein n=1 Tax=Plantactinospora veratri TaxID=1436122 RepID=A0ABU7SC03_9ACTN
MADPPASRLTRREIASGVVLGHVPEPPAHRPGPARWSLGWTPPETIPVRQRAVTPLGALEQAVLPALRRPPCVVSFSGGLDSSLVLAVALRVARREGLPHPVPVTWRFTGAPRADESRWQDRIVQALGIGDWQLLQADDDLDLVGPTAGRLLRRHGLRHPANLHLHLPIVELATGGSMLTGAGGDQVLGGWRRARSGPLRVRLRRSAGQFRAVLRMRGPGPEMFPWLRPEVSAEIHRAFRAERRREPRRLDRRIAWHVRRRDLGLTCASLAALGAAHGVAVVNPLLDPGFLTTLTGPDGRRRCPPRDRLVAEIAAGLLPEVVTAPRPKARFLEVFLRGPTRRFVQCWDGSGVDEELVDVAALRTLWSRWPIPGGTAGLVQEVWLASSSGGGTRQPPTPRPPGPEPRR